MTCSIKDRLFFINNIIIEQTNLKRLVHYGTKFRLPHKNNIKTILMHFIQDLDLFKYIIAMHYNKLIEFFNELNLQF